MKNMRKRILSLMVVLMMSLSLVQPTAFAATVGEGTEAGGSGDINIQTVVVEKTAPETPDNTPGSTDSTPPPSNTPASGENTPESQDPSTGDENTGDSSESEKPELVNPDGSINPDAVDRPEQSDTVTVTPGPATEEQDPDADVTPPTEETDPGEEGTTPPTEENDPGEEGTTPPTEETKPGDEDSKPEVNNPWELFYDEDSDTYKLTFNIKENAEGNQVLDLTNALDLLNQYAEAGKKELAKAEAELEQQKEQLRAELENSEEYQAYKAEYAEYEKAHTADMVVVKQILTNFGGGYDITGKTEDELIAEFNRQFGTMFGELAQKPEIPESIKGAVEAIDNLKIPQELYDRWINADVLQPGDIRKFEIFFTSDSKHTYQYKDGSFILATPEWNTSGEGFTGFDGQILPGEYIDKAEYHVTLRCDPIQNLLVKELGVDEWDAWNSLPSYVDNQVKKYLSEKYGQDTVSANLNAYLLDYYNSKDGTNYASIDELVKNNDAAKNELTKTATSGNKWFDINGETFVVDTHLETVKYDKFYKELFSFVYGDKDDIDAITGDMVTNGQYENDSWTDEGHKAALYYYMAHKEIWAETNQYFQKLLEDGLTADQAIWPSFMMALNIDGELTGNDWQNTKWPWYNSIELEQMDIDFSLTKKDGETGETITNSETGFQVYYIDKVKGEDGTETSVNMYCSYDEETQSYTFTATPGTVWTQNGQLNIDYAMMKDIVYYLQETVAPDGYEKDPNVYIVMNEDDYNQLTDEAKADLEGTFDKFLDMTVTNGGLSVSTDFINVKIVTTPDRPTPPPTPDPDPDPDPEEPPVDVPDPDVPLVPPPEEPPVDIPEEDPPLVDIPEEEPPLVDVPDPDVPLYPRPTTPTNPVPPVTTVEVEIPDEDVPLADVPNTGDGTGLWCTLGLMAGAGLAYLFLEEKKRQSNAQ